MSENEPLRPQYAYASLDPATIPDSGGRSRYAASRPIRTGWEGNEDRPILHSHMGIHFSCTAVKNMRSEASPREAKITEKLMNCQ